MINKAEETKNREPKKRIEIVSLRVVKDLELIREGSINYLPRKMSSPADVVGLCRKFLDNLAEERMIVICLDTKNQFNNVSIVSIGTLNSSLCHPREVYKVSIKSNSSSIVLAHNHPSGDPSPSNEDVKISKKLYECGNILGIKLLDHLIIGDEGKYVSLKEMDII